MSTRTRFEKEAKGNSEMAYSIAIYSLKWSVTPTFLSRNIFYLQLSPYCPKMNKKSMWEDLKISNPVILQLQGAGHYGR